MEFPPRHYPGAASLIEPELLGIESLFSFFGKLKFHVFPVFGVGHSEPMLVSGVETNFSFTFCYEVSHSVGKVALVLFTGDVLFNEGVPVAFKGIECEVFHHME